MLRLVCSVLLFGWVLLVVSGLTGCEYETVNNYACAEGVSDGGCAMGQYDDDEDEDSGVKDAGWRGDAQLFGSQPLDLNGKCGLIDATVLDGIPRVMTVALGFSGPLPPTGSAPGVADADIVAVLSIGIGGNMYAAEVDFQNGLELTIAAAAMKVNAEYRTIPGTPFATASPGKVTVAASLARGAVANAQPPQRTLGQDNIITPGTTVVYNVPTFAKSFRVMAQPVPNLEVAIVGGANIPSSLVNVVTSQSEEIEIPNGARQVWVKNNAIVNCQLLRLVFALSL